MFARSVVLLIASLAALFSCSEENTSTDSTRQQALPNHIAKTDSSLANHFFSQAQQFEKDAQFDSAIVYLNKATALFEIEENWQMLVRSCNALGGSYRAIRQLGPAHETLTKALQIGTEKLGDEHPDVATTHQSLGIVYAIMGQTIRAQDEFDLALTLFTKTLGENDPNVANVLSNLGNLSVILGEFDRAIEHYENALAIRRQAFGENDPRVADVYFALGQGYRNKGYLDESLFLSQKALNGFLATIGANRPEVARLYMNFGNTYGDLGDYEQALLYFRKALDIMLAIFGEQHQHTAGLIANIGGVYHLTGDHDKAISHLAKAGRIYSEIFGSQHPAVANNFSNAGDVYLSMGELNLANENYQKAMQSFANIFGEQHIEVANSYTDLGNIFRQQKKYRAALGAYDKALAIYHRTAGQHHPSLAACYNGLAATYRDMERFDLAIQAYNRALSANSRAGEKTGEQESLQNDDAMSTNFLVSTLSGIATTYYEKAGSGTGTEQDVQYAISFYQQAAIAIDAIRRQFKGEGSKLILAKNAHEIHEKGIQASLQLYRMTSKQSDLERAFEFAEKSRSGILLDALSESRARDFAGIPDSLLEREKQLRIDLAFYDRTIAEELAKGMQADSGKIARWRNKVFTSKQNREALIERFERDYPEYYLLKYDARTASVEDIRKSLVDQNTALVEFFTGSDSVYIFLITQNIFEAEIVPKSLFFEQRVADFRASIYARNFTDYSKLAHSLYDDLLAPAIGNLEAEHLIIIPDGILCTLPFDALLTDAAPPSENTDAYQRLNYLINNHALTYTYSATLLLQIQNREQSRPSKDYLAYAPIFPGGLPVNSRGKNFVNENLAAAPAHPSERVFGYLPASKSEVSGILNLFESQYGIFDKLFGGLSQVLIENEAKEEQLKSANLNDYRYLHFATHGFVNETNPRLSGLVLAQDRNSSEDGILHLGEIYNLQINADLVVLSACETGLGQLAKGEGIIGLTRGFLYAGAQNLLVSLWQVNDQTTADLMVDFYQRMLAAKSKADALRQSKLALINRHPEDAKPYYWASFILVGK